ncbi:hypothetical protein A2276_07585 [candidate division WOR-1 bacterium RIFOXYA12_FULL_43_27]|uniref:Uncharacterized protein n=1 Tax=candidate division WOR-1 bacterium RIFOXYC2_FULL_46_14 TaxID=1802587 RepID=A0A1F4U604_UNCSA|nr:MAG: hypothetical protein A2276_07585 [candidate division WOR-1 bacterium RIFOXYA12_FULL_43_27]OGC20464.1 MAG: hypothetical protein A2292_05410 [candidate division WOR-1 bacterium RIFOXYB2_FULL_46_45]OGC31799.1 MAG: hypothetical protein A2232_06040 [candidate division WOR-1 bacterium RIFOXYA2_FULL_46_56]OGC40309.1 MAG: hypothetical protein A2438_03430 [candidate division WOR-1 bacterium RIFOXYC2_FULL_46_14]
MSDCFKIGSYSLCGLNPFRDLWRKEGNKSVRVSDGLTTEPLKEASPQKSTKPNATIEDSSDWKDLGAGRKEHKTMGWITEPLGPYSEPLKESSPQKSAKPNTKVTPQKDEWRTEGNKRIRLSDGLTVEPLEEEEKTNTYDFNFEPDVVELSEKSTKPNATIEDSSDWKDLGQGKKQHKTMGWITEPLGPYSEPLK